MIRPIATEPPANGNPGIVPPWLQKPPVITLPVEPEAIAVLASSTVVLRDSPRMASAYSPADTSLRVSQRVMVANAHGVYAWPLIGASS